MRLILPNLVRVALLLLLPAIVFCQKPDYSIHFNSEKFTPVENIAGITKEGETFKNSLFSNRYYVAIQFYKLPDETLKSSLKNAGVELIDYLSGNCYSAAVVANVNIDVLKKMPIRSIFQIGEKYKFSPDIINGKIPAHAIKLTGYIDVNVISYKLFSHDEIRTELAALNIGMIEEQPMFRTFVMRVPIDQLTLLAKFPFVQWIEPIDPPNEADNLPGRTLHKVNVLGDGPRNLQGTGIKIGIWDGGPTDIAHPDFGPVGRVTLVENNPPITDHGTHVTGTAGGAGILDPLARGMAPKARIYSYDFTNGTSTTEVNSALNLYGINISSHSYGQSTTGLTCATVSLDYSATSRNTDLNINQFPYHLHVHSAGNSQTVCTDGFRTITGSGKSAKNNIVVANITALEALSGSSSMGPVLDGRIKPEISAFGTNVYSTMPGNTYALNSGTSMSTPGVSGTLALIVERFKQLNGNANPNASLIKAITCNTAKDLGNAGPDYKFGYGGINALKAVKAIEENRYTENTIVNAETKTISINVPAGSSALKVMLGWNDPAATSGAAIALINNLNLSVFDGTATTLPWILDKDNPANTATRGVDNLNNLEQVTIDNPAPGTYTFIVSGASIPVGPQVYSLTWEIESPAIEVTYPFGGESLDPGSSETITWNNTGITGTQTVQYSLDNGISWTDIATNIPATTTRLTWAIPAAISSNQALVRVSSGSVSGTSAAIFYIVGTPKNLSLVTNGCTSGQLTLNWTAVAGATHYDVLRLDNFQGNFSVVSTNQTTTTFTSTGLTQGLSYSFSVVAKNNTLGWISRRPAAVSMAAPMSSLGSIGAITGPATICSNTTGIAYTVPAVSGATTYKWTAPNAVTILNGQGTNAILVNFSGQSESGNITVYAFNNECQTSVTTFTVTVPAFTLTPVNPTICAATPVALTANVAGFPGTTFTWSPATGLSSTTGAVVSANPAVPTTYTVIAANGSGCNTSISTTVYIGDGLNAITSNAPVCEGGDLNLYTSPATGNEKYASIKFSEVSQFRTGTGGTPIFPNYVQVPLANEDFAEISNVDNSNAVDVSGLVFEVWLGVDLIRTYTIPNGVIIPPNQVMLLHIGDNGGPNNAEFRYFNTGGANNPLASANPAGFLLKSATGIIDVVATNSFAWPLSSGVTATDWSGNAPSTSGLAGMIRTQATDDNTAANWSVSSTSLLQSLGAYNNVAYTNVSPYNWSGPAGFTSTAQNPVRLNLTAAMAGNYSVNFAGTNACGLTSVNTNIVIGSTTIPVVNATNNNPLCFGAALNLFSTTVAGATYEWTGPNGFTSSLQNPTIAVMTAMHVGTYSVKVSLAGCFRTAATIVNTIELNGIYSVGPGADFNNLSTAVNAYNNATCLSGPVVFELISTYTSGAEIYPINILNHLSASAVNTLTIRPAMDATANILGSVVGDALIRFNGARYVTIDGRQGGTGTTKSLTIDNTAVSPTAAGSGTITFINGAENNTITYSNILSAAGSSTSAGNIMFRTTNTATGNSNNRISNNYISTSSIGTQSNYGLICDGTAATPNSNNIIDANEFRHFVRRPITLNAGLGNNWIISNNHLYFPGGGTFAIMRMIHMSNTASSGHTITGNFIGGTAVGATGTLSLTSGSSNNWWGMELTLGNATTTTVSNNLVRGITMTTPSPTTTYNVIGIAALAGKYNITGNTISGLTSVVSGTASTLIAGILYQNTAATTGSAITTNTVFDITNSNASTTNTAAYGMVSILSAGETIDIARNKIYNVRMPSTTSTASNIYGLFVQGVSGTGAVNINNNMISLGQNVTNNVAVYGLFNFNTSPTINAIFNSITVGGTATGANNSCAFFRSGTANATVINLRNNILNNVRTGGTGKHYALMNNHTSPATGWSLTASNYNNLNSTTAATLGLWGATDRTFATWQTSSLGDLNSKNIAPVFQNAATGDLRLSPTGLNCQLENSAVAGTGITIDYLATTRNATPTIGAHELPSSAAAPAAPVSGGNKISCETAIIQTLTATATVPAGVSLIWYDAPALGNVVASPILNTVGTITYYAEAVSQACAGNLSSALRTAVTLTINPAPAAPVGGTDQTQCASSPVQTLTATANVGSGFTVVWYDDATIGNIVSNPILNSIGTITYYAASRNNTTGCESLTRAVVTLTINATPAAPVSNGDQAICSGSAIPALSVNTGLGVAVQWYSASTMGTLLGTGNSYTPTVAGTFYAQSTYSATGCVSSNRTGVTLTINTAPAITCPANISVNNATGLCGANVTYPAATATGNPVPAITYSVASGSFFPIGITTVTATATNSCSTVSCTFTVQVMDNQAPTISCPANITMSTATGSCTAVVNYTIAANDNCPGVTTTLLTGLASGASFPIGITTVSWRATDAAGLSSTCSFTVTVNDGQLPVITTAPANQVLCIGNNASFNVVATNIVSYQWQVSTDGGASWNNISGANAAALNLTAVTAAMNNNRYRVMMNGLCTTNIISSVAILTVNTPTVNISVQPVNTAVCRGSNTSITVTATATAITYQWQVSINGNPFTNLVNAAPYSGVSSSVLNISNADMLMNGYRYRVIVSGTPCGPVNSNTVTLTVNQLPGIVLAAAGNTRLTPSMQTTLHTTVSPAGTYTYLWYRNSFIVNGATTGVMPVSVNGFGEYAVMATDINGCSVLSNRVSITDSVSSQLFVYPNPTSGRFQVRFYSPNNTTVGRTLRIYDTKGTLVYSKIYNVVSTYDRMDVNISNMAKGIYVIELLDAKGLRIAKGSVALQ